MLKRSSPALRGFALTSLLVVAEWAGMAACQGDGAVSHPHPQPQPAHPSQPQPQPQTKPQAQADAGVGLEASAAEASCAVDAGTLDDAQVALGQAVVGAHRCDQCHGANLEGNFDGVQSPTTEGGTAYPPNLTSDPATGLGCWTNDQIENAILNGIDNQGMPLCPPMPRWGHLDDGGLDAAEAWAVVQFLRSLPIVSLQVPSTPNCSQPEAGTDASVDDASPP
jgi:hypothetical protein